MDCVEKWRTAGIYFRVALVVLSKIKNELTECAANMAKAEGEDGYDDMLSDTLERLVSNASLLEAASGLSGAAAVRLAYVSGRLDELIALYEAEEELNYVAPAELEVSLPEFVERCEVVTDVRLSAV